MEINPVHPGSHTHRCVEPVHASAWPVQQTRPFHEALASANAGREPDTVAFSDELRTLNEEQRRRELRCETPCPPRDEAPDLQQTDDTHPPAFPSMPEIEETTEIVHEVVHRYEVPQQLPTGRLIDLLM